MIDPIRDVRREPEPEPQPPQPPEPGPPVPPQPVPQPQPDPQPQPVPPPQPDPSPPRLRADELGRRLPPASIPRLPYERSWVGNRRCSLT
jgi:hypothetical protein